MTNPDTQSSCAGSIITGLPVAIFIFVISMFLFQIQDSIPYFKIVFWIIIIILAVASTATLNVITQYSNCQKTDIGRAFMGALPTLGTVLLALVIASFAACRTPVISVVAPLYTNKSNSKNMANNSINASKNSNSKGLNIKQSGGNIENQFPVVSGISYGFYIMFGLLFGIVMGSGVSNIC